MRSLRKLLGASIACAFGFATVFAAGAAESPRAAVNTNRSISTVHMPTMPVAPISATGNVAVEEQSVPVTPQPQPQPKITTTKKIITTTTTYEEPCGKPFCEPVVTTHEENLPAEVSYTNGVIDYSSFGQPVMQNSVPVEYHSDAVDMRSVSPRVDANVAAKYSPEAYNVVATRATNRMLQDTANLYGNGKTVFLNDTKLLSSDLPYGNHRLKATTKDIISESRAFDIVNSASNADFIVDSAADWYVANNAAPALQYKLAMYDKTGRKINEWVEIIRQVQE